MSDKKTKQLGMNPSTAAGRLVKDILYKFVVDTNQNACYHCSEEMSRDTFSIEHMTPWLDSEDPKGLYFDLANIGFSHQRCNSSAARSGVRKYDTPEQANEAKLKQSRERRKAIYTPEQRSERYKSTGH